MKHVALLKGINVGGKNKIAMKDLAEMFRQLGFTSVATMLQSGNVMFESSSEHFDSLEALLEQKTEEILKVRVPYIVRTGGEWTEIIRNNPFEKAAVERPNHLLILFLKSEITEDKFKRVLDKYRTTELAHFTPRHIYLDFPDGIGDSKLANAFTESQLGTIATGRNWNTVQRIAEML